MVTTSHKHNTVNNCSDKVWPLLREAMFNTHMISRCKIWKR